MNESIEQIDPNQQLSIETVKKRAVGGALILTFRTFFIQTISFFSSALLTVFLEPSQFGVFFIVSAVVNFLSYFGDIGLAAALIQKKEKLTDLELRTIFTIQQSLVILLVLFVIIATPTLTTIYKFNQQSIYLLWALAFSLFLSSLKTIPSVMMERKLEFNKLVIPQIVETVLFNTVAVYLAWKGFGITSFAIAVLIRGISGLIVTYILQPWKMGFSFSKPAMLPLLKFGIPYQTNTFLAMVKDDGMTLFLGTILGSSGVGLLGWAQKWAYAPLRFFMDQVIKVTFPAFARLQDNKQELSKASSKAIFFVCLLVFPSLVLLILVVPTLTEVIPKYEKWQPALLALSLISITSALAAITTPLTNMFNAIGKISITFKLMIMFTTLTWVFVPVGAIVYGVNGAALGFSAVGLSSIIALIIARRYITIDYFQVAGKPFLGATVTGFAVLFTGNFLSTSIAKVIAMIASGIVSYTAVIIILEPTIITQIKTMLKMKQHNV